MNEENIIFIGGTGRCGTNILKDIFSTNESVVTLPFEHRILTDPDGVFDFYHSYSDDLTPFVADKRIRRLERLLELTTKDKLFQKLIGKILSFFKITPKEYTGWELNKAFPDFEFLNKTLISNLSQFLYRASYPGSESYVRESRLYFPKNHSKKDLRKVFGKYINELVSNLLWKEGKGYFVEDNTWNIFYAKDILEILPNSKIIHIYRDPRDVVYSFTKQRWTPNGVIQTIAYYRTLIEKWFNIKENLDPSKIFEIKFEDVILEPEEFYKLLEWTGIKGYFDRDIIDINKSHIGAWKNGFNLLDGEIVERELKDIILKLGYERRM